MHRSEATVIMHRRSAPRFRRSLLICSLSVPLSFIRLTLFTNNNNNRYKNNSLREQESQADEFEVERLNKIKSGEIDEVMVENDRMKQKISRLQASTNEKSTENSELTKQLQQQVCANEELQSELEKKTSYIDELLIEQQQHQQQQHTTPVANKKLPPPQSQAGAQSQIGARTPAAAEGARILQRTRARMSIMTAPIASPHPFSPTLATTTTPHFNFFPPSPYQEHQQQLQQALNEALSEKQKSEASIIDKEFQLKQKVRTGEERSDEPFEHLQGPKWTLRTPLPSERASCSNTRRGGRGPSSTP